MTYDARLKTRLPWLTVDGPLVDGCGLTLPCGKELRVFLGHPSERWTVRIVGTRTLQIYRRGAANRSTAQQWAENWIEENYPLWALSLAGKELP